MNNFISEKIQDFEKSQNSHEKCHKIMACIEFIIQFYAVIYYCRVRQKGKTNKQLVEVIMTDFYKKNPLLGSWIKLLRVSIDLLKTKLDIPVENGVKLQELALTFLPDSSKKKINNNPGYKDILDCISIIRNKAFYHSTGITEKDIKTLLSYNFTDLPYYLDNIFNIPVSHKILFIDNITNPANTGLELSVYNYTEQIIKAEKVEYSGDNFDLDSNLFYYVENDLWTSLSPFIIFRDNHKMIYSSIDNNSYPVYCYLDQAKYVTVKSLEYAFKQLVENDIDLINTNDLKIKMKSVNGVYHNLPEPNYKQFIGRIDSLDRIDKALKNRRIFLLSISGIGGVGKTTIAIKKAYDILDEKTYEFIIWVSAKRTYLTKEGIIEEDQKFTSLLQLLDVILRVSGFNNDLQLSFNTKKDLVLEILNTASFLLIVDNFETLTNPTDFLSFFEDIGDKCDNTKVIITTRHQLGSSEKIVELKEFSKDEFNKFIDYLSSEKLKLGFSIPENIKNKLFKFSGGLPLATEHILSQTDSLNSINKIIKDIENNNIDKENILEFSYTESFNKLSVDEKQVLFTISFLDQPTLNSICFITGLDEFDVEDIIKTKLQLYSLVNENYENNNMYYSVLPLTKIFLAKKIEESRDIKESLTAKIEEYKMILNISKSTSLDEDDLSIPSSDSIALKYAKAGYFLATHGDLAKAEEYFNNAIKYNDKDPWVWYFWALAEREASNSIREDYFEKAVMFSTDDKNKIKILGGWAETYYINKRLIDAIRVYNQIIQIERNKSIYHKLGKAYYEIGHNLWQKGKRNEEKRTYRQSLEAFIESLHSNPQTDFERNHNTIGHYYIAKIYRFLGDLHKSKKHIEDGLDLQPHNYKLQELYEDICRRLKI